MGEPSSCKPGSLQTYNHNALGRDELLEGEVGPLGSALDALRAALPSSLPGDCWVWVSPLDSDLRSLARDARHLDEWVGDVAAGFLAADRVYGPIDPRAVLTVDSDDIHVGPASRSAAEAAGRADAAQLRTLLANEGFVNSYDLENDRDRLQDLADRYPQLEAMLQQIGTHAGDADYCAALYNSLGRDNVQKLGDLANQLGLATDHGILRADAWHGFVVPLAQTLSAAERSGNLAAGVLDGIMDLGPADQYGWHDSDPSKDQVGRDQTEMRRRSLALLLQAGDWTPEFTARAANAITSAPPATDALHNYEGFGNAAVALGIPELACTDWLALRALQRSQTAENLFLRYDALNDDWHENVGYLVHANYDLLPGTLNIAANRLGISPDDISQKFIDTAADILEDGLLEQPLGAGTTYDSATTGMFRDAARAAGEGDVPDVIKQRLALISAPYTRDIAIDLQSDRRDLPPSRVDLSADDTFKFLKELSFDKTARTTLAENAAGFVKGEIGGATPGIIAGDPNAVGTETRLAVSLYQGLGQAMDAAQVSMVERREAIVSAFQTVTDPVVDLVSGKVVGLVPGVEETPVVNGLVDSATDALKDAVNDAIYDNLIPKPDIEQMTSWEDGVGPQIRDAVVQALYDDPAARSHFGGPGFNGTVDDFRALAPVQDAVNQYAEDILTGLDARMAFDKVFG